MNLPLSRYNHNYEHPLITWACLHRIVKYLYKAGFYWWWWICPVTVGKRSESLSMPDLPHHFHHLSLSGLFPIFPSWVASFVLAKIDWSFDAGTGAQRTTLFFFRSTVTTILNILWSLSWFRNCITFDIFVNMSDNSGKTGIQTSISISYSQAHHHSLTVAVPDGLCTLAAPLRLSECRPHLPGRPRWSSARERPRGSLGQTFPGWEKEAKVSGRWEERIRFVFVIQANSDQGREI